MRLDIHKVSATQSGLTCGDIKALVHAFRYGVASYGAPAHLAPRLLQDALTNAHKRIELLQGSIKRAVIAMKGEGINRPGSVLFVEQSVCQDVFELLDPWAADGYADITRALLDEGCPMMAAMSLVPDSYRITIEETSNGALRSINGRLAASIGSRLLPSASEPLLPQGKVTLVLSSEASRFHLSPEPPPIVIEADTVTIALALAALHAHSQDIARELVHWRNATSRSPILQEQTNDPA